MLFAGITSNVQHIEKQSHVVQDLEEGVLVRSWQGQIGHFVVKRFSMAGQSKEYENDENSGRQHLALMP